MGVSNLSPYQLAIQSAVGKGKGARPAPELAGRIADSVFGPAPVPPGSRITYQDPERVEWIDAEGYKHTATRSLDGRDPAAGQWRDNTNRPNILPNRQQEAVTQRLGEQVQTNFTNPLALAQIDPDTLRALQALSANEQARNAQAAQDQQGSLLAGLYANRVNQSSVANDAAARFAQLQGLVRQQQQADAAQRELQLRQFLTGQGTQRNSDLASLYAALSGQGTQRDIAGAGINLDYAKLAEQARQANQGFELGQQQADIQLGQSRSALDKVLKISQIIGNVTGAAGGGLGAYSLYKTLQKPQRQTSAGGYDYGA